MGSLLAFRLVLRSIYEGGSFAVGMLLIHILLHPAVHLPEPFLDLTGGFINGNHQPEDKLPGDIDEYGV